MIGPSERTKRVGLVIVGVLLGSAAVLCYWSSHQARQGRVDQAMFDRFNFLEPDRELGWRSRRGFVGYFPWEAQRQRLPNVPWEHYQVLYRIDEDGSRVGDQADAPAPGNAERLVWVAGDSLPFGLGVEVEHALAERLQRALREARVIVKNLSVVGYNAHQTRLALQRKLGETPRPPELIVVWVGFNNTEFTRRFFWTSPFDRSSYVATFVREMEAILALAREEGSHVVLLTVPCLEPSPQLDPLNAWIRDQDGRSGDVVVVDVQRIFADRHDPGLYAALDDLLPYHFHPSAKGHALVSERLLPVVSRLLAPQQAAGMQQPPSRP